VASPHISDRERLITALADRYRIERELGAGGMATVYLAQDLKHDRKVAVKVLRPELAAAIGADRFLREIRIAAQLQHPHILTLIDSGEVAPVADGGSALLYYVMPFVQGESLRERLTREGRLPVAEAIRILQEVLDALGQAHRQGIAHRDIKPENIMLSGRHALVVDFGVAKAIAAGGADSPAAGTVLTTLGLAIGTPAYMAPEQAAGQAEVDGRTDLYAVGIVAYEMLSGRTPFHGTPQAIIAAQITRTPEPLAALRPELPAPLASAVMRCLEKDPADRWQSAEDLLGQLESFGTPAGGTAAAPSFGAPRRRWWVIAAVAAALIGVWAWTGPLHRSRERVWAHETAMPRLLALADSGDWEAAYALARTVEHRVPGDSLFNALLPKFARRYSIHTAPEGARVWRKAYDAPDSAWTLLGRTPFDSALVAMSGPGGAFLDANRIRIEAPGYRTMELVGMPFEDSVITLDRDGAIPPEMVRVGGGSLVPEFPEFADAEPIHLGDYLIDRFEVTNRDYRVFVDSGGYRRQEFWTEPIMKDGRVIPWQEAMTLMTDRTGRTGPSTWEAGEYPSGRENDPVGGVSWYEAMAYARFRGKALPTVTHWTRAAGMRSSSWMLPASNFSGRGALPVGSSRNISAFGAFDMAGNVREWCLNAYGAQRYILGGGWDDPAYRFNDSYAQPPLDRSPINGIRLVRYPPNEPNLVLAAAPVTRRPRDLTQIKPVSDAVFAVYRQMFEYDRKPVNARVIETVDEGEWTRELVRLDAAYAGDSLLVYLYLPKRRPNRAPAVVFYPPGSAVVFPTFPAHESRNFDFLLKSGRAVLYPVYKGTYQRRDALRGDTPDSTSFYRDHVVMWGKDFRRAIDYLETRPEVSTARLAYFGISWGGQMGGLIPAIEPRIGVVILEVAGLELSPVRSEVDPLNYLPRIRVPTLMINGRYDFYFPVATSQLPMFRLLGTPPGEKKHVIEEGSHFVPRVRLIQETLAWLDKYQPLAP
jgi:formylglycine-generating enzyme required for sulfatase activity/tRNA A-37 threonylcarbamoyl transferase component Bud32